MKFIRNSGWTRSKRAKKLFLLGFLFCGIAASSYTSQYADCWEYTFTVSGCLSCMGSVYATCQNDATLFRNEDYDTANANYSDCIYQNIKTPAECLADKNAAQNAATTTYYQNQSACSLEYFDSVHWCYVY
jgi:hypothetical protein